jgi:hypothetical protein
MKKLKNSMLLFGMFIFLILSCKNKTVEPDPFEVKSDEFIKAEIDGKKFDYRTVIKTNYQEALKSGRTTERFECSGCKNFMIIFFGQKNSSSTSPYSWSTKIENATTNLLVDENTPVFYIGFRLGEKIDDTNFRYITTTRTSKLLDDWGDPTGDMIVKITSNENGIVSGTFDGKGLDGKVIKNGSFSLRYKL